MGTKNICKFGFHYMMGWIRHTITKIGFIALQSNKHSLLFLLLLFTSIVSVSAQEGRIKPLPIKAVEDSIVAPTLPVDIIKTAVVQDSVQQDTVPKKQGLLLDKIKYKAKDYVKISQKDKKIYLYNEAEIYYQDTELKAGTIILDYEKNEVYAGRIKDSLGNYSQLPNFKQGNQEVVPDSIRFNFTTQKALIWNSRTEQKAGLGSLGSDAMKVYSERTKKENDSVYFLDEGRLTTSQDTLDPDYHIRVRKAKLVPGKKVIAGYSNLYIVNVPTPIALPFAYFPLTTGNTAGLIFPTFGNDPDRGYFLQGGGYYFPFSEHIDLSLQGDFYTNGSYGFRGESNYVKRYKYRGNINFSFENLITSQPGFDDFSRSSTYNIRIRHTQDAKASPNSTFSASVNLGSSQFFRNSLQQQNFNNIQTNTLSSSISYSRTFPNYPSVRTSISATHNQNTNTGVVNLTLPTFQASMERIFPFAKRDGIKKGAIQNINFQYDVNASNSITTNEDDFLTGRMFDNARVGARHRIPISTNFKVAKFFSVTAGGTYEDVWTLETFNQRFDPDQGVNGAVVRDTIKGFDRFNQYNFNLSVGTTIYGTYTFKEGKKIQALRHTLRPSVTYGYAPSFEQFYDTFINGDGEEVQFSRFQGTLNGAPRLTQTNSLSLSLANTLEAKVIPKDSTATELKKVSILNSFNVTTGYNFEADSLRISPVNISGGTTILNNKMSINFGASLDPYAINNNGRRINTFNIDNGGSLFRLTNARATLSYSISSSDFNKKPDDPEDKDPNNTENLDRGIDEFFSNSNEFGNDRRDFSTTNDRNQQNDGDVENPYYENKLPWDLRMSYTTSFTNTNRQNEFTNNSLTFSGNISLSPRWRVGVSSGYDIRNKGFTLTQFNFQRDLKSFTLRFDWTPFGQFTRWYFFIGIKSSILKDLKWENRSQPVRR